MGVGEPDPVHEGAYRGNIEASSDAVAVDQPKRQGSLDTRTLSALLERVGRFDEDAFAELYDVSAGHVYGMVLRVIRDPGYSEEITQETFLQIWRTAGSFDPHRGSPLAWMITMAHRRAVDRVRAAQSDVDRESRYSSSSHSTAYDDVLESVTQQMEAEAVARCMYTLTDTQREAVHLAYYRGLTYREVADELGVAVSTVKTRMRDGLIKLRKCLEIEIR